MSVTFERDVDGGHRRGYHYASAANPNRSSLEEAVAELEGGSEALAYSTGSAAIAAVLHIVGSGGHVVIPDDVFQGTVRLLRESLSPWGVSYSSVDMTDLAAVEQAVRPETRMVLCEALSNPLLKVTDIGSVAQLAHRHGAVCVVDSSFVTPVCQRPLSLGADYVVHATTKYMAGHADVLGGILVAAGVAARLRLFTRATSFGAPESLVQHQATAPTHGTGTGLYDDLLRLSIGFEHPEDLIADLDQALAQVHGAEAPQEEMG